MSSTPLEGAYPGEGLIVFVSDEVGQKHIFSIHPDGSNRTQLTTGEVFDTFPTWSHDGSMITFLRAQEEHPVELRRSSVHIIRADGSGLLELTTGLDFDLSNLAWSPDDSAIAFDAGIIGNEPVFPGSGIFTVEVDTGSSTQVAQTNPFNVGCTQPSWSPDNLHLIFRCRAMMNSGIVLGDRHGSEPFAVDMPSDRAIWLPSGEGIAVRGGWSCLIAQINAQYMLQRGEDVKMELECMEERFYPIGYENMAIYALHWSRLVDGRVILQSPELMQVVDLERGSVTRVELDFAEVEGQVSWGPNEESVVFTYFDGDDYELGVVDLLSGEVYALTDNAVNDMMPSWQP